MQREQLKPDNYETNIKRSQPTCHWLHRHRVQRTPDPPRQQQSRPRLLRTKIRLHPGFQSPRYWSRQSPHHPALIFPAQIFGGLS